MTFGRKFVNLVPLRDQFYFINGIHLRSVVGNESLNNIHILLSLLTSSGNDIIVYIVLPCNYLSVIKSQYITEI